MEIRICVSVLCQGIWIQSVAPVRLSGKSEKEEKKFHWNVSEADETSHKFSLAHKLLQLLSQFISFSHRKVKKKDNLSTHYHHHQCRAIRAARISSQRSHFPLLLSSPYPGTFHPWKFSSRVLWIFLPNLLLLLLLHFKQTRGRKIFLSEKEAKNQFTNIAHARKQLQLNKIPNRTQLLSFFLFTIGKIKLQLWLRFPRRDCSVNRFSFGFKTFPAWKLKRKSFSQFELLIF